MTPTTSSTMISPTSSPTSSRPGSTTPLTEPYLDHLAHLIAARGIAYFESDIARLVVRLRSVGLGGTLTDVLADHGAPTVARERAFGKLLGALARGRPAEVCNTAA